jgi:hypothetical protein
MLYPSGISTIAVGFKFTDVDISLHCTEVENGLGQEMIHLIGAIKKTCCFAGINLTLHSLWITAHLSK